MFNSMPKSLAEKVMFENELYNWEFYTQLRLYQKMGLLRMFPSIQNKLGDFTHLVTPETEVVGDVMPISDGVDFSELKFDNPTTESGKTVGKGFKLTYDSKLEDTPALQQRIKQFLNASLAKLITFYEKTYMEVLSAKASSEVPDNLKPVVDGVSGSDIVDNEISMIDAMEHHNNDLTGFTPNYCFVNRKDYVRILKGLDKFDLRNNERLHYISSPYVSEGQFTVLDSSVDPAVIHKYADPNYSILATFEDESALTNLNLEISDNDYKVMKSVENFPPSLINLKRVEGVEPRIKYVFIWVESNLAVNEPWAIMNGSWAE